MKGDVPVRVVRIFRLLKYLSEYPPKTIEKLGHILETSPKTIYKDLQLIESLGYEPEKDSQYRYCLRYSNRSEYHLDEQEKKLIIGALKKSGLSTVEITSITQKLKSGLIPEVAGLEIMKQLNLIKILMDAIVLRTPLILEDYQSTTPGAKIRNRHVLPLYFDDMRMSVTAYDFDKGQAQIYKLARMKDIKVAEGVLTKDVSEILPLVDDFGFAGNLEFEVSLLMSRRAASILSEEFRIAGSYISDSNDNENMFPYLYKSKVCGYEGVGRFVLGLMTEIKVLGDSGFKTYLKEKITAQRIL